MIYCLGPFVEYLNEQLDIAAGTWHVETFSDVPDLEDALGPSE